MNSQVSDLHFQCYMVVTGTTFTARFRPFWEFLQSTMIVIPAVVGLFTLIIAVGSDGKEFVVEENGGNIRPCFQTSLEF